MAKDNTARHTSIEALLRRDKLVTVVAVAVLVVIAAFYTIFGVGMKMSAIEMTPGLSQ